MNIQPRPLKDGRPAWRLTFELGIDPATGERIRRIETFRGVKRDAEKYWRKRQAELERQGPTTAHPEQRTVGEYIEDWLKSAARDLRPTTASSYDCMVRVHIIPALGKVKLTDLKPLAVQTWIDRMQEGTGPERKAIKPRTAGYARTVLRIALQDAVRLGIIPGNPVDRTKPPKQAPRKVEAFTIEQAAALFARADSTRLRPLFEFAFYSGMRRGELLALTWADVDMEAAVAYVHRSRVKLAHSTRGGVEQAPKTESGKRTVALPAGAVDTLRRQWAAQARDKLAAGTGYQDHGLIFPTAAGEPLSPDNVSRDFRRLRDAAKLPALPFHALRHTAVSVQIAAGVPVEIVSKRIGHRRISTTMDTYGHLLPEANLAAAQKVDEYLAAVGGGSRHQNGTKGKKKARK